MFAFGVLLPVPSAVRKNGANLRYIVAAVSLLVNAVGIVAHVKY
jgi:hypothetical protein